MSNDDLYKSVCDFQELHLRLWAQEWGINIIHQYSCKAWKAETLISLSAMRSHHHLPPTCHSLAPSIFFSPQWVIPMVMGSSMPVQWWPWHRTGPQWGHSISVFTLCSQNQGQRSDLKRCICVYVFIFVCQPLWVSVSLWALAVLSSCSAW